MKKILWVMMAIHASVGASAQKLSVAEIVENRSTGDGFFSNNCKVYLKLSGDELRAYKFARIGAISKATDDQGIDMISEEEKDTEYKEIAVNTRIPIALKSASRKASSIKEINGFVKLYTPSEGNGSMIRIDHLLNRSNPRLLPDGLPLQVSFVHPDSVNVANKQPAVNKDSQVKSANAAGKALAEAFSGIMQGFFRMDEGDNQLSFLVEGDRSKLVDIKFQDETGQPINHSGRMSANHQITYRFRNAPGSNWKVIIYVESEGSVKSLPFSFTNVELP